MSNYVFFSNLATDNVDKHKSPNKKSKSKKKRKEKDLSSSSIAKTEVSQKESFADGDDDSELLEMRKALLAQTSRTKSTTDNSDTSNNNDVNENNSSSNRYTSDAESKSAILSNQKLIEDTKENDSIVPENKDRTEPNQMNKPEKTKVNAYGLPVFIFLIDIFASYRTLKNIC